MRTFITSARLMDEVFGIENFVSIISIRKTTSQGTAVLLGTTTDFLVWYARNRESTKYRQIFTQRSDAADERYDQALLRDGSVIPARDLTVSQQINSQIFRVDNLTSSRPAGEGDVREFGFRGSRFTPGRGTFKTNRDGFNSISQRWTVTYYFRHYTQLSKVYVRFSYSRCRQSLD